MVMVSKTGTCEHAAFGMAESVKVTEVMSLDPRLYVGLIVLLEKSKEPSPDVDQLSALKLLAVAELKITSVPSQTSKISVPALTIGLAKIVKTIASVEEAHPLF